MLGNPRETLVKRFALVGIEAGMRARGWRGPVGRLARAVDKEVGFDYLMQRSRFEDAAMDRIIGASSETSLKFSVIVPSYGIELHYVKEMLQSLWDQTYRNWELCICDDNDPLQDVGRYLRKKASRYPEKIRYIKHDENFGIARATRSALSLARGDVMVFVDADDLLHRRALEAMAARFGEDEAIDVVYSDHDFATDLGFRHSLVTKPAWSPELLITANYINHLTAVRRECLEACEGVFADEAKGSQDWDACFRFSEQARRISHIPLCLYHWRGRPGSIASGDPTAKPWVHAAALRARLRYIRAQHPLLTLDESSFRDGIHREPRLEPGRDPGDYPKVHVVRVGQGLPKPDLSYSGVLEHRELSLSAFTSADWCPGDYYVFVAAQASIVGDLDRLMAYAIQPNVGGVWPFRNEVLRLAYSSHPAQRKLFPVEGQRSTFSTMSGNILTGPLHGLVIAGDLLRQVCRDMEGKGFVANDPELIGALVGLITLRQGKRNAAVRGVITDYEPGGVSIPKELHPGIDPYI